jgi:hypothetical protein
VSLLHIRQPALWNPAMSHPGEAHQDGDHTFAAIENSQGFSSNPSHYAKAAKNKTYTPPVPIVLKFWVLCFVPTLSNLIRVLSDSQPTPTKPVDAARKLEVS